MCESCGCGDKELVTVNVGAHVLEDNQRAADHNREHFAELGMLAINLMGSPGSGKTAILEATARAVAGRLQLAAVSGDLATDRDAQRLRAAGIPSKSITTGTGCHLDARLVHHALHDFEHGPAAVLVIENVGNLVCPAVYDLGQAVNVVALSVTEGEDKPLKYPVMFRKADLVLVTKIDLLEHLPQVRLESLREALGQAMVNPAFIEVSAVTGRGVPDWVAWVERRLGSVPTSAKRASLLRD